MFTHTGQLRKMHVQLDDITTYKITFHDYAQPLNQYIGQNISMQYTGDIFCISCSRKTKKSFNQGYCYVCFRKSAACDMCIMKPELCHYHLGTCREPRWGEQHCMQPHIVYLANSSGAKVGITRQNQIPTRWIDQGATQALAIAQVYSRFASGILETILKQSINDKTNWQKMLKGSNNALDLIEIRDNLKQQHQDEIAAMQHDVTWLTQDIITEINYPVTKYPDKIKSINLDKTPQWQGILQGIKGQYLLTSAGVINMRKYTGYEIKVDIN